MTCSLESLVSYDLPSSLPSSLPLPSSPFTDMRRIMLLPKPTPTLYEELPITVTVLLVVLVAGDNCGLVSFVVVDVDVDAVDRGRRRPPLRAGLLLT